MGTKEVSVLHHELHGNILSSSIRSCQHGMFEADLNAVDDHELRQEGSHLLEKRKKKHQESSSLSDTRGATAPIEP